MLRVSLRMPVSSSALYKTILTISALKMSFNIDVFLSVMTSLLTLKTKITRAIVFDIIVGVVLHL